MKDGISQMSYSKNAKNETIFTNDFELEKFADEIVSGWVQSKMEPVTRNNFRKWLKQFNFLLNSSADEYFQRVEIIKKNMEVLRNARM